MKFTPDHPEKAEIEVPYFEDNRSDTAPGYRTRKSIIELQNECALNISKLGGDAPRFRSGVYGTGKSQRHGYEVQFRYNGLPSVIQVAGLPMRIPTETKRNQVLAHALFTVNEWLKTMYTSMVFSPGYSPLVQFVLVPGTNQTVGEYLMAQHSIPNLNPSLPSGDVITVKPEVIR